MPSNDFNDHLSISKLRRQNMYIRLFWLKVFEKKDARTHTRRSH